MKKMAYDNSYDFMQAMARKQPDMIKPVPVRKKQVNQKTNNNVR
jgi:hypothetical protein